MKDVVASSQSPRLHSHQPDPSFVETDSVLMTACERRSADAVDTSSIVV